MNCISILLLTWSAKYKGVIFVMYSVSLGYFVCSWMQCQIYFDRALMLWLASRLACFYNIFDQCLANARQMRRVGLRRARSASEVFSDLSVFAPVFLFTLLYTSTFICRSVYSRHNFIVKINSYFADSCVRFV